MRILLAAILSATFALPAFAGEAEIRSAQSAIDGQLKALLADDGATCDARAWFALPP